MLDDPITLLERELVQAARRRAVVADDRAGSGEPRGPWPLLPGSVRRRSSLGGFAVVVLSGLAVAVALGALVSLRGQRPPTQAPPARPPAHAAMLPGRQRLIDDLGVLRRPQTSTDLHSPALARFLRPGGRLPGGLGRADLSLVRRATVTPWGSAVLLVAVKPSRVTGGTEAVALVADPGAGCCATAAEIERDGDSLIESAGRWSAGRATKTRLILVVPDGVHRVKFAFPSQAETVVVHGNVAAVQADEPCCTGQPALIWYGANGGVIKRIASRYPPPTSHRPARLPAPR